IEDIDRTRARTEFEAGIFADLAWLGLAWEAPVRRQSEHFGEYKAALDRLAGDGLVYPCFCTRAEIQAEIARASEAPHEPAPHGADGPIYPGTCRGLDAAERARRAAAGDGFALRLDMGRAIARAGPLHWTDRGRGRQTATPAIFGDVVLARKETPT